MSMSEVRELVAEWRASKEARATPIRAETRTAPTPARSHRIPRSDRPPLSGFSRPALEVIGGIRASSTDGVHRVDDDPEKVDYPRAPPGGHIVVQLDDGAVGHRSERLPARALGHRDSCLATASGVGQEDQVRVGIDHVLGRQLRVAPACLLYTSDAADE